MKKGCLIIGIIFLLIVGIGVITAISSYNKMVELNEAVTGQWGQVENVYQRRLDLIPNLVSTVKGYAAHEKETLTGVIEARAKATSVTIKADNLDEESIKKYQEAQSGVSSALSRLMMVQEKYPDLKANTNFMDLQNQLKSTEDGIAAERKKFNEIAQSYNTYIRKFPKNIWAGIFGFKTKGYFEADAEARKAPKVQF